MRVDNQLDPVLKARRFNCLKAHTFQNIGFNCVLPANPYFQEFYNRDDTFSLGICNGCQLMALLGRAVQA